MLVTDYWSALPACASNAYGVETIFESADHPIVGSWLVAVMGIGEESA